MLKNIRQKRLGRRTAEPDEYSRPGDGRTTTENVAARPSDGPQVYPTPVPKKKPTEQPAQTDGGRDAGGSGFSSRSVIPDHPRRRVFWFIFSACGRMVLELVVVFLVTGLRYSGFYCTIEL